MKIAMITPGYLPVPAIQGGAVEVLIEELLKGNEKIGRYKIDVYTVKDDRINTTYKHTDIIQVKIKKATQIINKVINKYYQVSKKNKWRTSFSRELVRLMKEKNYDLIVVHNNLMAYRDIYEMTDNKYNMVYVLHNNIDENDYNHILIAKLIGHTAKKVLAVSKYTANQFKRITGTDNVEYFYNCIDIKKYTKNVDDKILNLRRNMYGLENNFVFMYSGRIDIYKGILELIVSFKKANLKNTKLLIVGKSWFDDGADDEFTKKLIKEAKGIKDKVVFTGFVHPEDMPIMYKLADCLVIPSMWEEPFGVVALEGMISRLPLIVTNSGGLMEIVDNETAFIVNKEKDLIDRLATAMTKIVREKTLAKKMGEKGYKKIVNTKDFDSENYFSIFCEKIEKRY